VFLLGGLVWSQSGWLPHSRVSGVSPSSMAIGTHSRPDCRYWEYMRLFGSDALLLGIRGLRAWLYVVFRHLDCGALGGLILAVAPISRNPVGNPQLAGELARFRFSAPDGQIVKKKEERDELGIMIRTGLVAVA